MMMDTLENTAADLRLIGYSREEVQRQEDLIDELIAEYYQSDINNLEDEIASLSTILRVEIEEGLNLSKQAVDAHYEHARLDGIIRNIALIIPTLIELGPVRQFEDLSQHPYYTIGGNIIAAVILALPFEVSRRRHLKNAYETALKAKEMIHPEDDIEEPLWLKDHF